MSILSVLAQSSALFLVTALFPDRGEVRLSVPVFNPLHGLFPGERRVLGWKHQHISGAADPGSVVRLEQYGGALCITGIFRLGVSA